MLKRAQATWAGALMVIISVFMPWITVDNGNRQYASINGVYDQGRHSIAWSMLLIAAAALTALASMTRLAKRRPAVALAAACGPPLILLLTITDTMALADRAKAGSFVGLAAGPFFAGVTAIVLSALTLSSAHAALRPNAESRSAVDRVLWICAGALTGVGSTLMPWDIVWNDDHGYESVHGFYDRDPHSIIWSLLLVAVCGLTVLSSVTWLATRRPVAALVAAAGPPLMLLLTIVDVIVIGGDSNRGTLITVEIGAFFAAIAALATAVPAICLAYNALRPGADPGNGTERVLWACAGAITVAGSTFMPWGVVYVTYVSDQGQVVGTGYQTVHGLYDRYAYYQHSIPGALLLVISGLTVLSCIAWLVTRRPPAAIVAAGGPPLMLVLTIINAVELFTDITGHFHSTRSFVYTTSTGGGAFVAGIASIMISVILITNAEHSLTPNRWTRMPFSEPRALPAPTRR